MSGEIQRSSPAEDFKGLLAKNRDAIAAALPKHFTPDRMIRIAATAYSSTPLLQKCTLPSLCSAVLKASEAGLEPSHVTGECYLVPFSNKGTYEATLIVGYKGLMKLARNSGELRSIRAVAVYEKDEFSYEEGLRPNIIHMPTLEENRGDLIYVYAVAQLKDNDDPQFVVLTRADVEKVRAASKSGKSEYGPWNNWYEEMAKKTAIKRLCKMLPMSIEAQTVIHEDEQRDLIDIEFEERKENGLALPARTTRTAEAPKRGRPAGSKNQTKAEPEPQPQAEEKQAEFDNPAVQRAWERAEKAGVPMLDFEATLADLTGEGGPDIDALEEWIAGLEK